MPASFYKNPEYKKKQSEITKKYWQEGKYNLLITPLEERCCINPSCEAFFKVKPFDPKIYCSHSCSARVNNLKRGRRVDAKCVYCGVLTKRQRDKYCSNKCQMIERHEQYIKEWKNGLKDGNIGISMRVISPNIRRYLFKKYNSKCSICGWSQKNPMSNKIPLEVDHIDGNAENNKEENLRLLCPNCHSLTASFRNLNKGKGRSWRLTYRKKSI